MKTARFIYKDGKHTVYANVTLKNDGKISVNVPSVKSSILRFRVKQLANTIVKNNFVDDSILEVTEVGCVDSKLLSELKVHTKELKYAYIERTKQYANGMYDVCVEKSKWTDKQWYEKYNVMYEVRRPGTTMEFVTVAVSDHYSKKHSRMLNDQSKVKDTLHLGREKFVEKRVKEAEYHYEDSMVRLCKKLNEVGVMEETDFTVTSQVLNDNFECYITHPNGVVKAWTIIAGGPIQQPHYRYLVNNKINNN